MLLCVQDSDSWHLLATTAMIPRINRMTEKTMKEKIGITISFGMIPFSVDSSDKTDNFKNGN